MAITKNNAVATDLLNLFVRIRRNTEMRARANDALVPLIVTESKQDAEQIFEYLRLGASYIADRTRITINDKISSGFEAVRNNFLTFKASNIELFNFPEQESGTVKRSVLYEYALNALVHFALSEWYRDAGVYDIAQVEMAERDKYVSLLNDNSTTTKLFKAKYIPSF